MTRKLLDQTKEFELFAEQVEKFIHKVVMRDEYITSGKYKLEDFDLRTQDTCFFIPKTIFDYAKMWEYTLDKYNHYKTNNLHDGFYLDVYYNDKADKTAYYHYLCLWITFDSNGINYTF